MRSLCTAGVVSQLRLLLARARAVAQPLTEMGRIRIAAAGYAVMLLLAPAAEGQSPLPLPSPTAQAAALGTAEDALAWLGSMGFSHVESSSTAEGTSRWVATLPMSGLGADVSVETVGSADALTSVTLRTALGADFHAGSVIVMFMQRFAPDSLGFVVNALLRGAFLEGTEAQAERADGTITVAMTRTEAALPSEETMPIAITVERSSPSPGQAAPPSPAPSSPRPQASPSPRTSGELGTSSSEPAVGPLDVEGLFPDAAEVGEALGLEFEARGIRDDMSQIWEGTRLPPSGLLAKGWQLYGGIPSDASGIAGGAFAVVSVDIDRFAAVEDAGRAAAHLAAVLEDSTLTLFTPFQTRLSGDLVTAGSMTSDEGFGGSTVLVQDGPLVVVVVVARTGATEQRTEAQRITELIIARARGEA